MKRKLIKSLSVILSAIMFVSGISIMVIADEVNSEQQESSIEIIASGICGESLTWSLDENGLLQTSGSGEMYNFDTYADVPWYNYRSLIKKVELRGADTIGDYAFYDCSKLTTIDERWLYGMKAIGKYAFFACSSLECVYFSDSATVIEEYCFANSGIERIHYTEDHSIETIGKNAFSGCQFDVFVIPENVKKISANAFNGCYNLSVVAIPESVTEIAEGAFSSTKLNVIYYTGSKTQWNAIHCDDSIVKNISPVCNIDDIGYCGNSLIWLLDDTTLDIVGHGDMWEFDDEITYGQSYFLTKWENAKAIVTEINFPELITSIGDYAFCNIAKITEIDIPDGIKKIGRFAFNGSAVVKQINIPESVTEIGEGAFYACKQLENINIPNGVNRINDLTFCNCCNLKDLTLYNGIESVGFGAFFGADNFSDIYYYGTEDAWNLIQISREYNDAFIDATVHFVDCTHECVEEIPAVSPTCTKNGLSSGEICGLCGKILKEQTIISDALGHNYDTIVTAPTCTEQGFTTYTCECGDSYIGDYVAKLVHSEVLINEKAETATENGYTGDIVCSVCGAEIKKGEIIPATGEEVNNCSHLCHKSGILGIFWKIICFFQKLFGMNPVCECGAAHY